MFARFLCALPAVAALNAALFSGMAIASSEPAFPSRPITVTVPFAAGGASDTLSRILAKPIEKATGQPVVVENKPGGASTIGTNAVLRAAPDGYSVLTLDSSILVNPGLLKQIPYDTLKQLRGVTMLGVTPLVLMVPASLEVKDLNDLIAKAKADPEKFNYASGGYGTTTHIAAEMLNLAAGTRITHIPYPGSAPALQSMVGAQTQLYFGSTMTALPYLSSGRARALAVTGSKRNPQLPDVPTFDELGVKGVDALNYWGIYVRSDVPDAVVEKLNHYFVNALRTPEVAKTLDTLGIEPIGNSAAEHNEQLHEMVAYWKDLLNRVGIQMD